MTGRTVLWAPRRHDRQACSDADRECQAQLWFLHRHAHLERAPALVGHTAGLAVGRVLRRLARLVEG